MQKRQRHHPASRQNDDIGRAFVVADQVNHLLPEGRSIRRSGLGHGGHLLRLKIGSVQKSGSTPLSERGVELKRKWKMRKNTLIRLAVGALAVIMVIVGIRASSTEGS